MDKLSELIKKLAQALRFKPGCDFIADELEKHANGVIQLEAEIAGMKLMEVEGEEFAATITRKNEQLEADLEERTNQYHLAHAKILSREAIIEQLSETQLAKDVADLESTIAEVTKLAKEPIVNCANDEHNDALLRLVRIIEVLEEGNNENTKT